MRVFENLKSRPSAHGRVVVLGVFDGLHLGHERVILSALKQAKKLGLPLAVLTFRDMPERLLEPEKAPPAILSPRAKLAELERLGCHEVWVLPFTRALSRLSPQQFAQRVLLKALQAREVWVGEDFVFGRGASGHAATLRQLGKRLGFKTQVAPELKSSGRAVSSTRLRQLIRAGKLAQVKSLLGRAWELEGRVVPGRKLGSKLGYPTANLDSGALVLPKHGVWGAWARIGEEKRLRPALVNIGVRPTLHGQHKLLVEAHLLKFSGSLYGRQLSLRFVRYLRGEKKFKTLEGLKQAIASDQIKFQGWLKSQL